MSESIDIRYARAFGAMAAVASITAAELSTTVGKDQWMQERIDDQVRHLRDAIDRCERIIAGDHIVDPPAYATRDRI